MNKNYYAVLAVTLAGLAIPGSASALDFAVGASGGTMGTGVQATLGLNSHLNLRFGVNSGEYEIMEVEADQGLEYDNPTVDFDNQYLMLDFYPFSRGNLHLTAGYFKNKNSITAAARVNPDDEVFIGSTQAPPNTEVTGLISCDDGAYAGIGFGNAVKGGFIHFGLDIGVVLQGSPKVGYAVIDETNTIQQSDIEQERAELEEEVKDFDMWPVISLSLSIQIL
jgi:hypothetical protein